MRSAVLVILAAVALVACGSGVAPTAPVVASPAPTPPAAPAPAEPAPIAAARALFAAGQQADAAVALRHVIDDAATSAHERGLARVALMELWLDHEAGETPEPHCMPAAAEGPRDMAFPPLLGARREARVLLDCADHEGADTAAVRARIAETVRVETEACAALGREPMEGHVALFGRGGEPADPCASPWIMSDIDRRLGVPLPPSAGGILAPPDLGEAQ